MAFFYLLELQKAADRGYMFDDNLLQLLQDIAGQENVSTAEPMKLHTTFKIGGPADFFVTPVSMEQVSQLVRLLKDKNIPYYIVGNGSNLLVSDSGIRGVIIQLYNKFNGYEFLHSDTVGAADKANVVYIKAKAGISLGKLGNIAADNSLTGFEFAGGIPGTLGGAVAMNAGAYGGEIKDVIVNVTVMDADGNIYTLDNEELEFGYRTSVIQKRKLVVLEAVIALHTGDSNAIKQRMSELSSARREKQPLEYPSAGSTFKRPKGYFAAKLIEDAGLKGFSTGGAKVSDKHAGFVINTGNAAASDVIELMDTVSKQVFEKYGVKLEPEVKLLGF